MTDRSDIGVVVIGRNEGERLKRCLRSIPPGLPVIYVDSASSDDSVPFAGLMGAAVVELDMMRPFTAARARNAGAHALREHAPHASYIQFIDGDCELEAGWIEAARTFLASRTDVAVACGRRRERFASASLYNQLADEEWSTPVGEAASCGGDALVRRDAFDLVGGFDPAVIAGEEPEFCQRLRLAGWRICRLDAAMTIHDMAMDRFSQWWARAVRGGFGYAQTWHLSRTRPDRLYGRELFRALAWSVGIPVLGIFCVLVVGPAGLIIIPGLWMAQFLRLSVRSGPARAALLLAGKAAEALGALRYAKTRLLGRASGSILYK